MNATTYSTGSVEGVTTRDARQDPSDTSCRDCWLLPQECSLYSQLPQTLPGLIKENKRWIGVGEVDQSVCLCLFTLKASHDRTDGFVDHRYEQVARHLSWLLARVRLLLFLNNNNPQNNQLPL